MLELSVLGIHLFVAALYSVSASKTGELRVIIFYNHRQSLTLTIGAAASILRYKFNSCHFS